MASSELHEMFTCAVLRFVIIVCLMVWALKERATLEVARGC
jgi:hypothetical protein